MFLFFSFHTSPIPTPFTQPSDSAPFLCLSFPPPVPPIIIEKSLKSPQACNHNLQIRQRWFKKSGLSARTLGKCQLEKTRATKKNPQTFIALKHLLLSVIPKSNSSSSHFIGRFFSEQRCLWAKADQPGTKSYWKRIWERLNAWKRSSKAGDAPLKYKYTECLIQTLDRKPKQVVTLLFSAVVVRVLQWTPPEPWWTFSCDLLK